MKRSPALQITFVPEAATAVDLRDRLVAGLDDFQPTAIEESATTWRVFFDSPSARDRTLAWLREVRDPRITTESLDVEDEDWARRSQADLRPVRVGRIVVTPPWCEEQTRRDAHEDDLIVLVVPSTGFGTGHHASTRLCLALLQQIPVRGRSVLDVGTGSGVLAIAAARLGTRHVVAIDHDADAIEAARENVALNGADGIVRFECGDFRATKPASADTVLANLTGDLLRRFAPELARLVAPGGDLIVSGVLAEEGAAVVDAFQSAGARLMTELAEDGWVGLRLRMPNWEWRR